ncbi:hypothetical protein ACFQH1_02635 [Lactiplantibacillus daoliensis]|uniref:Uncharacterized protein n=1 Tax=Lactiplantibacillus daoliensis TaxID=2559916 RepID=A0ABW1UDC1_9LACO|nr:CpsD/CapB family tyrosine-protein kinase [Lactiplantibacillus daoliensis]
MSDKKLSTEFNMLGEKVLAEVGKNKYSTIAFYSVDMPKYRRTVIANIGFFLSRNSRETVLVNLDENDAAFLTTFELEAEAPIGVSNNLRNVYPRKKLVRKVENTCLSFVPYGTNGSNFLDTINNRNTIDLFNTLKHSYEFILVNMPTNIDEVSLKIAANLFESFILVTDAKSSRPKVNSIAKIVGDATSDVIGTVFVS